MYRQSGTRNYVRAGPTAVWTLMLVAFLQFLLVERATAAPVDIRAGSIARRESEASILGYTLWKWKWKEDLLGHLQVAESDHTTTMTFEMQVNFPSEKAWRSLKMDSNAPVDDGNGFTLLETVLRLPQTIHSFLLAKLRPNAFLDSLRDTTSAISPTSRFEDRAQASSSLERKRTRMLNDILKSDDPYQLPPQVSFTREDATGGIEVEEEEEEERVKIHDNSEQVNNEEKTKTGAREDDSVMQRMLLLFEDILY